MKRELFIVSCWITLCALFVFEYVLVVISIWQHIFGIAMCMSEMEKSLGQMLGVLIVFVRFSFFWLLKCVGFYFLEESDIKIASCEDMPRGELSCALYGVLLNLINPLSVVCVVGIFDVSHMHYFWVLTPFWAFGVVLLGKKRRIAGLQLMILKPIKPSRRPKVSQQIMLVCEFCRRCTKLDWFLVFSTLIFSFLIGYIVSKFTEEQFQNSGENSGVIDCDYALRGNRSSVKSGFAENSLLINKVMNSAQNLSMASALIAHPTVDTFAIRRLAAVEDMAQYASDLNDVMDEMLNRSEVPADYAETMVALFHDKSQGDVIRDFAVQHIGLYAETLKMRGKYDADSTESATLRDALWDAAEET